MDVKLIYNPFFGSTALIIDGMEYRNSHGRLASYLNMPIEKWIENNNGSYRSWNGFFVELLDELNDDDVSFTFQSDEKYFEMINEAFANQRKGINGMGFDADRIKMSLENIFDKNKIKQSLCNFVYRHLKLCKKQCYMEDANYIYSDCKRLTDGDDYTDLYKRIVKLLEYGKKWAVDKGYWDDSIRELNDIYGFKER